MLQVFYLDVAKVDRDVAYVSMAIQTCFEHMFQMFLLFQTYAACVLSGYSKSRYERAHVAMAQVAGGQRPATTGGTTMGHHAGL
jgi:hypothetical protein